MTYFQDNAATLLPNGLTDLLPPQAEAEAQTIESFMRNFSLFGFARVKPPLVEFEESLLGEGPGQALARKTFRLMDPVSQRMMGVRADVTAQIARIANSRLAGEARPLRLSYAADVLRVNGTQLRPERQFVQVGCELIGENTKEADAEVPLVALTALAGAGIAGISIDLTVPTLIQTLYEETRTPEDMRVRLDDLIEKRDLDGIRDVEGAAAKAVAGLLQMSGVPGHAAAMAEGLALPAAARAELAHLLEVAADLRAALNVYKLNDVQITLDPLERRGFEYQTGVSFTLFAKGARGELGRGGRYAVSHSGESASGFTLYMDSILRVLPVHPMPESRKAQGWEAVRALQVQGISAVRG